MTLKELRQSKNMSQKDLANAIGVDVSVISRYESGKVIPPAKRMAQILSVLQLESGEQFFIEQDSLDEEAQFSRLLKYSCLYSRTIRRDKNYYVEQTVLLGANGHCELCKNPAPFLDKNGRPYLELHHINANNKEIEPEKNLIALCPNCHRKIQINPSDEDLLLIQNIAAAHNF